MPRFIYFQPVKESKNQNTYGILEAYGERIMENYPEQCKELLKEIAFQWNEEERIFHLLNF